MEGGTNLYSHADNYHLNEEPNTSTAYPGVISSVSDKLVNMPALSTYGKNKYQMELYGNVYNVPQFPPSTSAASPKSPSTYLIPNEAEQATEKVSFMVDLNDYAKYKNPSGLRNNFVNEKSLLKPSQEAAGTSGLLRDTHIPLELPQSPSGALTTQISNRTGQATPERVPSMLDYYNYNENAYLADLEKNFATEPISDVPLQIFPSTSAATRTLTSNGAINASTSVKLPYTKEGNAYVENTYPIDLRNNFMTETNVQKSNEEFKTVISEPNETHNIPLESIPCTLHVSTTTPRLTYVISSEAAHTPMGNALINTGSFIGFDENKHPVNIQDKFPNAKSILRPKQQITGLTNLNRMYNPLTIQIPNTSTAFSATQTRPAENVLLVNNRNDFAENKNPVYLQSNIGNLRAVLDSQTAKITSRVNGIQNQNHNLFHPDTLPIRKTVGSTGAVPFTHSVIHPPASSVRNITYTLKDNNEHAENKYPVIFPNNVHNAKPISKCKRNIPVSTASKAVHIVNVTPALPGTSTAASALTEATRAAQNHSLGKVPSVKIVYKNPQVMANPQMNAVVVPNDPQLRPSTSRAITVNVAKQVVNDTDAPFRVFRIKEDLLRSSEEFNKRASTSLIKVMQYKTLNLHNKRKYEEDEFEVIDLEPNILPNADKTGCMLCFQQVQVGQVVTLQECHHKFCKKCLTHVVQSSDAAVVKCPFKMRDYFCDRSLQDKDIVDNVPAEVYAKYIQSRAILFNSQAQPFFICSTPSCSGWWYLEANVNTYQCPFCKQTNCHMCSAVHDGKTCEQYHRDYSQREFQKQLKQEFEGKESYEHLIALDNVDLVANTEKFECPICFQDVDVGQGATLRECLHNFCKECLAGAIEHSETATVKCPFQNDEYSCESCLQEREVKALVSQEVYDKYLQRSVVLAESQAQNSFHCKTPDCPGWCLFEDGVNTFRCPACKHVNCLTCAAIHEGMNCLQYQDDVAFRSATDEDARRTRDYLQSMVDNGDAMRCPQCKVILMKMEGCDWLKCSMCKTEVCWVTKGARWGPMGYGDSSGGCKCKVNGISCHPNCRNCH